MGFVDNLASQRGSGVYGSVAPTNTQDVMGLVNQLKDREMNDFKNKAVFMGDLSLKQDKMRALFNPDRLGLKDNMQPNVVEQQDPNMMQNPNSIPPLQQAELGIKQKAMDIEGRRLDERSKQAQAGLDIRAKQERLNQEKSDQIHEQKMADMQRKADEADAKIEQAKAALNSRDNNAANALKAHQDLAATMEERHKLEMAMKQAQFDKLNEAHQETIKQLEQKNKQGARTKTTIEQGGQTRTTTTERGDAADTVNVIGKDGKQYTIPKDKLNDMDADGTPHWKQQEEE